MFITVVFQYLLPALVHISNQPKLVRGDGPIVSSRDMVLEIFSRGGGGGLL